MSLNILGKFAIMISALWFGASSAAILATSGDIVVEPASSRQDAAQVYLFDTCRVLYDWELPQTFPFAGTGSSFLPAGTSVFEYRMNYHPASQLGRVNGTVTFDTDILGIIPDDNTLEVVDEVGFPFTADTVVISLDHRTLSFSLNVNGADDSFRLFVSNPVPEPGTAVLAMAALLAFATVVARRPKHMNTNASGAP